MEQLINKIYSKNSIKRELLINAIYIGDRYQYVSEIVKSAKLSISLRNFVNPLAAYADLKKSAKNVGLVFCELKQESIDVFYYISKLQNLLKKNTVIIFLSYQKLPHYVLSKIKGCKVTDVFQIPLDKNGLECRLKYLLDTSLVPQTINGDKKNSIGGIKINVFKRGFDIALSSIALILLSPLFLIVTIAIKTNSKGPVFFNSKRVGRGYKIFTFYKFRTMKCGSENLIDKMKDSNQYKSSHNAIENEKCVDCEKNGRPCSSILYIDGKEICENLHQLKKTAGASSFMKFSKDPRVTPLGQFLRKSSIDELPQLVNILMGDMSFVGNRPLPLYEAEKLTSDQWSARFSAPAGLTGLWQVTKRGKSNMSETERKELDNNYASNNSFWGDMALILKTFRTLIQKENV